MRIYRNIQILEGSEENRTIQADKNSQWVDIQIQGVTINYQSASGDWSHEHMIMLYDQETGLFGWRSYGPGEGKYEAITGGKRHTDIFLMGLYPYLLPNKMVYFRYDPPYWVEYREFHECYTTLKEARTQFLSTLETEFSNDYLSFKTICIIINQHVTLHFKTRRRRLVRRELKLSKVTYHNSQWTLTIESKEGEQTFVILDDNYNILEVSGYGAKETKTDPSYGVTYKNDADFEEKAVFGYVHEELQEEEGKEGNTLLIFKAKEAEASDNLVEFSSSPVCCD